MQMGTPLSYTLSKGKPLFLHLFDLTAIVNICGQSYVCSLGDKICSHFKVFVSLLVCATSRRPENMPVFFIQRHNRTIISVVA